MSFNFHFPPSRTDLFKEVFDNFPFPLLIMDERLHILHLNKAAAVLGGNERKAMLYRQNGDAFHCVHAQSSAEGCGHARECAHCAVRNGVKAVFQGKHLVRDSHHAVLGSHGHVRELDLRLTIAPLRLDSELLALVMMEELHPAWPVGNFMPAATATVPQPG